MSFNFFILFLADSFSLMRWLILLCCCSIMVRNESILLLMSMDCSLCENLEGCFLQLGGWYSRPVGPSKVVKLFSSSELEKQCQYLLALQHHHVVSFPSV